MDCIPYSTIPYYHFQNNGKHLLWNHVREAYHQDGARELRMTKLTPDHIWLTYSVMKVNLAAQVFIIKMMKYFFKNIKGKRNKKCHSGIVATSADLRNMGQWQSST